CNRGCGQARFWRPHWLKRSKQYMKTNFRLATLIALTFVLPVISRSAEENDQGFRPLFNGKDLTGWKLRNPSGHNSWSIQPGGVLRNTVEKGGPQATNPMTDQRFWTCRVPKQSIT